ncbi:MAG: Hsp20/alpha crystallin family protein [Gemmataceae bacterium]
MFGIVPWRKKEERLAMMPTLRRDWERLMDRVFGDFLIPMETELLPERYFWAVDEEETDKEFIVRVELPGFEVAEITLEARDNYLLIRAEHKEEPRKEEKEGKVRAWEKRRFERMLSLPAGADVAKAEACYRNGVLEVRLPKTEEAKGRPIPVSTA